VTRVAEVEVGRLPEGAAFSPDGTYLYVANDLDDDLWTFKVGGHHAHACRQALKLRAILPPCAAVCPRWGFVHNPSPLWSTA